MKKDRMVSNLESELERLEKLCEEATPGVWEESLGKIVADGNYVCAIGDHEFWSSDFSRGQDARNSEFITASRTALPMLIKKLRTAIAALDRIADPTPSIGRPSFADWELRQMSREALSEIRGEE